MKPVEQSVLSRSARWPCLLCLLLLAAWLRWDFYPKTYFADELIPLAVVKHMASSGTLDSNWEHADWRGDFAGAFYKMRQYNFSSYLVALHGLRSLAHAAGADGVADLALYRSASLVCQLLALLLVFQATVQMAGSVVGLIAVAFLAVMPQGVVDAHYARAESFVMLLIACLLWLASAKRQSLARHLFAAGLWGVAVACKFSFAPLAALGWLYMAMVLRSAKAVMLWLLCFVLGIFFSAPYILLDFPGFLYGIGLLLQQYTPADATVGYLPSAGQLCAYLQAFFSWPVLLLLALAWWGQRGVMTCFSRVALVISLAYLLLFARQGVFFERNLSHLLPLWAVLFAVTVQQLAVVLSRLLSRHFTWRVAGSWFALLLACVLLFHPLQLSRQIVQFCFRDTLAVRQRLNEQEQAVLQAQQASGIRVPGILWNVAALQEVKSPQVLLRQPLQKIPQQWQWEQQLTATGFVQVARIDMPLGQLPYNQLQINHIPPAYLYYRRASPLESP